MKKSNYRHFVVITFISLPIAFLLIAWLVNLPVFDEDLAPELAGILQPVAKPVQENNAYFAMWGISAAANKDMVETGVRLVERYHDKREKGEADILTTEDFAEILGAESPDEAWLAGMDCNARLQYGCLAEVRSDLQAISITSERARLMFDRHQQVLAMPRFQNWGGSSFTSPIPPYITMLKLSQLKLASVYDSSTQTGFLEQLAIDMRFWKMMLAQGSELIDKMFAIAGIWVDIQFLSEYLKVNELSGEELEIAASLLQALTSEELNIAEAFESEQRTLFNTLRPGTESLPDYGLLVTPWLIQANATQNSYYKYITLPVVNLSGLSGADFFSQTPLREQKNRSRRDAYGREAFESMTRIWPGTLYNIGGKVLLSSLLGFPTDYVARIHDLNSMISLVKLQLSVQSKELESINRMIRNINSDNQLSATMFAGKKLEFDTRNGWLQFDCQYQRSVCKINLYGDKVSYP